MRDSHHRELRRIPSRPVPMLWRYRARSARIERVRIRRLAYEVFLGRTAPAAHRLACALQSVELLPMLQLAPSDPVREVGARTDSASPPACSSPLSIALRQRVSARSSMSGASWRATLADGCTRETLVQSPRAVQSGAGFLAHALRRSSGRQWVELRPTIRLARLRLEWMTLFIPATTAAACGRETLIEPPRISKSNRTERRERHHPVPSHIGR
jgi:hypothetical protein